MSQTPPNYLILVKHSQPEINPAIPSAQWTLSEEGRQRCIELAQELEPYQANRIFTSIEPKAQKTASLIAQELDLPILPAGGLHEQERASVPYSTPEEFQAGIKALFEQPDVLVFGDETANEATHRFSAAIDGILSQYRQQNVVIVSHGTVMTLWLAQNCGPYPGGVPPFQFWRELGLPAFIVLSHPDYEIITVVNQIPRYLYQIGKRL
jgi:2,3-bisphosphoglycerate-dependent phosphoglycerate mutase